MGGQHWWASALIGSPPLSLLLCCLLMLNCSVNKLLFLLIIINSVQLYSWCGAGDLWRGPNGIAAWCHCMCRWLAEGCRRNSCLESLHARLMMSYAITGMVCSAWSYSLFTSPTQFPISKFPVVLNIFETEQLQIGNCVETTQNCVVLSPILFTPPTRTRQDKTVLSRPCRRCEQAIAFCIYT